jgi:hypothetical protein
MATATTPKSNHSPSDTIHHIGETAGLIWHALQESGPLSLTKLAKEVDAPKDVILLAIGWLAREDKIDLVENSKGRTISLR